MYLGGREGGKEVSKRGGGMRVNTIDRYPSMLSISETSTGVTNSSSHLKKRRGRDIMRDRETTQGEKKRGTHFTQVADGWAGEKRGGSSGLGMIVGCDLGLPLPLFSGPAPSA
jgi:hypothetical protein